jgi:hypothetical protein
MGSTRARNNHDHSVETRHMRPLPDSRRRGEDGPDPVAEGRALRSNLRSYCSRKFESRSSGPDRAVLTGWLADGLIASTDSVAMGSAR